MSTGKAVTFTAGLVQMRSGLSPQANLDAAVRLIEDAKKAGADAADAGAVRSISLAVEVRDGKVEETERAEGDDVGLRVLVGRKQAVVSTNDLKGNGADVLADEQLAARDWWEREGDTAFPGQPYKFSATPPAAVRASISTPVRAVARASAVSVTTPPAGSTSASTPTKVSGSGWQSGISSLVRLAAWIPASRAVPRTSPFGASPAATAAAVWADMRTSARATARRSVTSLPATSTIRARPDSSRCDRPVKRASPCAGRPR